jgi:hypothetical protein
MTHGFIQIKQPCIRLPKKDIFCGFSVADFKTAGRALPVRGKNGRKLVPERSPDALARLSPKAKVLTA